MKQQVLREKLRVAQRVKNFPTSYGTQWLITVFKRAPSDAIARVVKK
jgi:hypothetical protein